MNEKKRKQKLSSDLDCFSISTLSEQTQSYEDALDKLDEKDMQMIDAACTKLLGRLQYANIKSQLTYKDGLEVLAKLGMFLSLVDANKKNIQDK